MKTPKYYTRHVVLAALGGMLFTLLASALALWLFLGPHCITLLEGWGVVRSQFVEDYDPQAAVDGALNGLVESLGDRWSYYLTASEYEAQNKRRDNSYVGIGVTVSSITDERGLLITDVKADGPAGEAGLKPGEIILAADGYSLAGDNRSEGADRIQGQAGTDVVLTILDSEGMEREVTLTRRVVRNESVRSELLPDGTGYVRLENFYSGSGKQLCEAVNALVGQGAKALVFDVRNNGGGYVTELTEMLDHLLPEGPIFRTQYKNGTEEVTRSDASCVDLPMAVLVNSESYSAAEFFGAQLRESVQAVVVGEDTSGKGRSQQAIRLANGGALNLSTARYCTGEGVSLVGTGVTLDAVISLSEADSTAFRGGTLAHADDVQLQKALELLGMK